MSYTGGVEQAISTLNKQALVLTLQLNQQALVFLKIVIEPLVWSGELGKFVFLLRAPHLLPPPSPAGDQAPDDERHQGPV